MDVSPKETLPPPPGIINSIKTGFDLIATHLTAILLPLFLNLFLWLGPRLRMNALLDSTEPYMISTWKSFGIPTEEIQQTTLKMHEAVTNINLFWLFHTFPIGVPNLLLPQGNSSTPLGSPVVWQVSAIGLIGWVFLLTFLGWIGGGLYFRSVAWLTLSGQDARPPSVLRAITQTILISVCWGMLSVFIGMPVSLILSITLQISTSVANFLVLILGLVSMWLIVPLFFWPHGVFLKKQNVLTSILSSLQMMRFALPTSSLFVLTIFLLSFGLNFLWSIPPENSWMTLVGILGHSFVATALLASSFVYYRDMTTWLQSAIERLKLGQPRHA